MIFNSFSVGKTNVHDALDPVPSGERAAFNVVGYVFGLLVDRVGAEIADRLAHGRPRTGGGSFGAVSSDNLDCHMASAIEYGDPFDAGTPRIVFFSILQLVVYRVQCPSADDEFFDRFLLANCVTRRKDNSEAEECQSGHTEGRTPFHTVHRVMVHSSEFVKPPNHLLRRLLVSLGGRGNASQRS